MSHFILQERPIRIYEKKEDMLKQNLERMQAAQILPIAEKGKKKQHTKAANALLPKHFRD
jgi:hypothetical protein